MIEITTQQITPNRETIKFEKLTDGIYVLNYKTKISQMKYTKEQIQQYLESDNDVKLREISRYFFGVSGEYRRLVSYFGNILTMDYLITPKIKSEEHIKQEKFNTAFETVLNYTDNSYVKEVGRYIANVVVLEGVFYGYERQLNNTISIQQLPSEYCRSRFKIDDSYSIEFNLRFFDTFRTTEDKIMAFDMFPEEFLQYYINYKNLKVQKTDAEWVLLNPEFARCHKLFEGGIPLLSTLFPDIIDLKEYKDMDKTQSKMNLYKLIVQKIPFDKEKGMLFKLEEAQELHKNAKKMINQEGLDVLTTPFDVDSVNLQEKGSTLQDNIEKGTNSIYSSSGTSKVLFNSGKNGGSIGLSQSIKTDESVMFPLLDQFKIWYDNKINKYIVPSRNYNFETTFLPITIFNRKEMVESYTNLATLGYSKLLPIVASGIKQTTFLNILSYENDMLKLNDKMVPLSTSYTQSGKDDGGRPEKSVENKSPITETQIDNGITETRAKK